MRVDQDWRERFIPEPMSGCFLWEGAIQKGYGTIRRQGKNFRVHRLILEEKLGRPLLPGMNALHTCDVRLCGNDHHLYEGTHSQNLQDAWERPHGRPLPAWLPESNRGSRRRTAKLKEEDIAFIRDSLKSGTSTYAIAEIYGVARSTILNIKRGITWRHV